MVAFLLAPIYLLVNIYIYRRTIGWMAVGISGLQHGAGRAVSIAVYVFFAVSSLIAFLLPQSELRRIMKEIGNYWLGVLLYMIFVIVLADIARLFLLYVLRVDREKLCAPRVHRVVGRFCAAAIFLVSVLGVVNAGIVRVTPYEITVDKALVSSSAVCAAAQAEADGTDVRTAAGSGAAEGKPAAGSGAAASSDGESRGVNDGRADARGMAGKVSAADNEAGSTAETRMGSGAAADLKIILVSDLHLGYNIGLRQMEKMVAKINAEKADLVVIAGDIFDNEWEAVQEPGRMAELLRGIRSKYGVYACYGNHDIEEPILAGFTFRQRAPKASSPQMDAFLSDAGIQLLRDEGVLIDGAFYLYGRADAQRPGAGISERKSPQEITADMDKTRPIIVIDHQPRELAALAAAGVDIDLCGHTHDGQMFPGNLVVRPFWENFYGYLQKGSMHNIVTSGVGLFGPNMRVGTKAEICPITVHFSGSVNAQETTD